MITISKLRQINKQAIISEEHVSVFFDGTFSEPQLNHPEGIAIDSDGNIFCGGEKGEIFRIDHEGKSIEQIASTDGFVLGVALDSKGFIYSCDLKKSAVFRTNIKTGEVVEFARGDGKGNQLRIPNFPVIDEENGFLYVSDSYESGKMGPGIWRFDLQTGNGSLWYDLPLNFANGMALSPSKDCIYVAETFASTISRIPILSNDLPGEKEVVVELDTLPDGIAIDGTGRLYISCYEPSLIYRFSSRDGLELVYYDDTAHTLCHPTNCAIFGNDLYTSNLGRWHITKLAGVMNS